MSEEISLWMHASGSLSFGVNVFVTVSRRSLRCVCPSFRVDEELRVKVADSTLAQDVYELDYYRPGEKAKALPVKWMSPEALEHELFTSKGDVVRNLCTQFCESRESTF